MKNKYICIHGHFYQPPRENPWLEEIECQDSAYPYHDWNERINFECYAPNTCARILDENLQITNISNNYEWISFNFGPTLLSWLEHKQPETYHAILKADQISQERLKGHGNAIAQIYNHTILPLSNDFDKYTQIYWGIKDFEHRFKRFPEGMWLSETAVDLRSLEIMAELGIKYTVLSPYQAKRIRQLNSTDWQDVRDHNICNQPFVIKLPSGKTICVFFYDGKLAQAIAFESLLKNGDKFAKSLTDKFAKDDTTEITHVATDGETYGHHHRHGDMALAYALDHIKNNTKVQIVNYGYYLEKYPPQYEIEIHDNTSWSCAHGVKRWYEDCGCHTGQHSEWNQLWRKPLRDSLDWLRDALIPLYEQHGRELMKDPWWARNEYINIILNRSPDALNNFIAQHQNHILNEVEKQRFWKLLELQRHTMLMYTSCGWFFEEISGIETTQILQYADRAIQLANELFNQNYEDDFIYYLSNAKSNIKELLDGKNIYYQFVKSSRVTWKEVAAHFAISSLFEHYEEKARIYSFKIKKVDQESKIGDTHFVIGKAQIKSIITREHKSFLYAVIHYGAQNLSCFVCESKNDIADDNNYYNLKKNLMNEYNVADFSKLNYLLHKNFGLHSYSISSLFRDEQRKIVSIILKTSIQHADILFERYYTQNDVMIRFLTAMNIPQPNAFECCSHYVLNRRLTKAIYKYKPEKIKKALEEILTTNIGLNETDVGFALEKTAEKLMRGFVESSKNLPRLQLIHDFLVIIKMIPCNVDLWQMQNQYFKLLKLKYLKLKTSEKEQDKKWCDLFIKIGGYLEVHVQNGDV